MPNPRRKNATAATRHHRPLVEPLEPRLPLAISAELVRDIQPGLADGMGFELVNVNGVAFFPADDGNSGLELWRSDGTTGGTFLVKDIKAGAIGSLLSRLTNVNGTLYFTAVSADVGYELWKSDGTAAGTLLVKRPGEGPTQAESLAGDRLENLTNVGDTLFFTVDAASGGEKLWKSDGTAVGTVPLNVPRQIGSDSSNLTPVGSTLYFATFGQSEGADLWRTDGTESGTVLVKNFVTQSFPFRLTSVSNTLFFVAEDANRDRELWKSDGTETGTVLVKDINPGVSNGPTFLTNFNGILYFSANDGVHGYELWRSDGTAAGTVMVRDLVPGEVESSAPFNLTNANGTLFFATGRVRAGSSPLGLWKSDGTEAGTVLLKELFGSVARDFTAVGNELYFRASTGQGSSDYELWTSDGTATGTLLVKDINPGASGSYPRPLANVAGRLFFGADDGQRGHELWATVEVPDPPPPEPPPDFDLSPPNRAVIVEDPLNPGQRVLLVVGGDADDVLIIEPRPSNRTQVRVRQNGQLLGIFNLRAFQRIAAFGLAGHDTIVVDTRLTKSAEIHGGAGNDSLLGGGGRDQLHGDEGFDTLRGRGSNDILRGGDDNDALFGDQGNDLLLGEAGDDSLFGGLGRDILLGGQGWDFLSGQQDEDILLGDATTLEDDAGSLASAAAIWNGRGNFASRTRTLANLIPPDSLLSDDAADTLFGGAGRDWFLTADPADVIRDLNQNPRTGDRRN